MHHIFGIESRAWKKKMKGGVWKTIAIDRNKLTKETVL